MLIFPLKKEWFDKIKSGEKTIEYREVKGYWQSRFYNEMGFFPERELLSEVKNCGALCLQKRF